MLRFNITGALASVLLCALASSATASTTTDVYGYVCIREADLDAAYLDPSNGKGVRLPQTCLGIDAKRTPETLASSIGRPAYDGEWSAYSYRWFTVNDPDRPLFGIEPITPAPVPLPGALWSLLSGLAVLSGGPAVAAAVWRRGRAHCGSA